MKTISSALSHNGEAIFLFAVLTLLYLLLTGFKRQKNWAFYFAGLLFMVISVTLTHAGGTSMPFTLHMSVHMLLLLICGPCMVIGWPQPSGTRATFLNKGSPFFLTHLFLCWIVGIGIMWFWHVPAIFNALMQSHSSGFSLITLLHLASLLLAGIIFSWPILHTNQIYRVDPPVGIIYLFTACMACSLLGMLITFAPAQTYRFAMNMDAAGPVASDQQAAGLMMWVPGCFLYLTGILYLVLNWIKEPRQKKMSPRNVALPHTPLPAERND